jgi:hypothetical protein
MPGRSRLHPESQTNVALKQYGRQMRCWSRTLVAGSLAAAAMMVPQVGGAQEATGPPDACTEPYGPIDTFGLYGEPVVTTDPVDTTMLESTQTLDGSGSEIVTRQQGTEVIANTSAGEVRLSDGGRQIYGVSAGDLDGDGVGEIWVFAVDFSRAFIVSSGTAPGAHDVATVGTRVPPGVPVGVTRRWQGGLLVAKDTGPSFIEGTGATYPPADLMAPGPGGDATGVAALAEYPGVPRAIVGFTEPQLIVTWSEESALRLRSLSADGTSIDFTTASGESSGPFAGLPFVSGGQGPGGRYLQASDRTRNPVSYLWSYDDPCGRTLSGPQPGRTPTSPRPEPQLPSPSQRATEDRPIAFTG